MTATEPIARPALYSTEGLSFWGGVDPLTGAVIDQTHPLHGQCVADKILCIPSGRGSCTGSQVLLELILNGKAPRAIVLRDADAILCTGAIVAEEFFGGEIGEAPAICAVGEEAFAKLVDEACATLSMERSGDRRQDISIHCADGAIVTKDLLRLEDTPEVDRGIKLDRPSPAAELAMHTIRRVGSISGATELIPIVGAHIDAVTYIGPGGLRFAQRLAELGAKVTVPTTLNSQSCDRRRWKDLGVDASLAANANAVGDAYLQLGCEMSFTCAPYLLPSRPKKGEDVIWGESNAVVYSNSVIGARTEKYADYFDICAAIVGCVPKVGVHVEEQRLPTIAIDATKLIQDHLMPNLEVGGSDNASQFEHGFDSFFPAMGWTCGHLSDGGIPLILGFDELPLVSSDNLKAFCAAFGTTGSAPLFHMANITPEAMGDDVMHNMVQSCDDDRRVEVTPAHLQNAYETLDSGNDGSDEVSLIALGNPHLSLDELGHLSNLYDDGRPNHGDVEVIATLGRHIQTKGTELGYTQKLESFGVKFVNDTCWCMLLDPPIIPPNPAAKILTNSGKYAHYGPGLTNRRIRFGSMLDCVEAAKSGRVRQGGGNVSIPKWLRSFSTQQFVRAARTVK